MVKQSQQLISLEDSSKQYGIRRILKPKGFARPTFRRRNSSSWALIEVAAKELEEVYLSLINDSDFSLSNKNSYESLEFKPEGEYEDNEYRFSTADKTEGIDEDEDTVCSALDLDWSNDLLIDLILLSTDLILFTNSHQLTHRYSFILKLLWLLCILLSLELPSDKLLLFHCG